MSNSFATKGWQLRWPWLAGFLICAALMGYAYYSQFAMGLDPCPLCVLQRVALIAVGVVFLAAAVHGPARLGAIVYALITTVAGATGVGIAGRHIWLQNLPADQVPACGPSLDYLLNALPLFEALERAFTGSGDCAEVDWTFLGLSMPTWVLIWFILLVLWAWYAVFRLRNMDKLA